jgi:hypothetical protein
MEYLCLTACGMYLRYHQMGVYVQEHITHIMWKHHVVDHEMDENSYKRTAICHGRNTEECHIVTWSIEWTHKTIPNSCKVGAECKMLKYMQWTFHVLSPRPLSGHIWTQHEWRQWIVKESKHTEISWLHYSEIWCIVSKVLIYVIPFHRTILWMHSVICHFCSATYVTQLGRHMQNWICHHPIWRYGPLSRHC